MRRTQDCELTANPITCFDECSRAMKEKIRDYFTKWSKHFRENPRRLTDAELRRLADGLVFRGWTSAESLPPIKFHGPKLDSNRIQVGRFIKDLPDPKKARTIFQDDRENGLFNFLGKPSDYVVPRDRKAGEAAYMRARLD
ncbi:hypothetical protein PFICI_11636 [Pestalotiopsis fici W106-1]|uniref:Uncharacterized protein n=1 Tax=Pestalotiopsis fici (strain W106-1 / CGMCC3.15140) TaxID=1229662 RepID=W3WQZ0_PESFW|nr:uncharacterized protein PFICI_11636 [Pestalotiopsis fici W106-1]ETS76249.1 hypothetical protein PFICI_11636 [Pestalotiopsis fici W106-1]